MIKENINDLIVAIAEGDSIAIDTNFNAIMTSKISDRLDDMRVSVAADMFGSSVVEESVELDEALEKETIKHPVGQRPKGAGWTLKQAGEQTGKDHSVWERKVKKVAAPSFNKEEVELDEEHVVHYAMKNPKLGGTIVKASYKNKDDAEKFLSDVKKKGGNGMIKSSVSEELSLEDYSIEELEDFMMSEEFEQLDELSKQTLGSYVKKASTDKAAKALDNAKNINHSAEKLLKRHVGINKAVDKLTKEEVEELDELSKQTLGSYVKKASDSVMSHSGEAGYKLGAQEKGEGHSDYKKAYNRNKNIHKAVTKLVSK